MNRHPYFPDILLHTDAELAEALGTCVQERSTIHEWPLSCVQKVLLEDGRTLIYKAQLPPTVEVDFYEKAASSLLPAHQALGRYGDCDTMVLDWIDGTGLCDLAQSPDELHMHGKRILALIGEIRGDLPVYLNLGTENAWSEAVGATLEKLGTLVSDGRFGMGHEVIGRLRLWCKSTEILKAISREPRVIHGDLNADQIFITKDGYRVIDWQRPCIGPAEVDLVTLLVSRQIDPELYVERSVVEIYWFLLLYWAVEAQYSLFPDKRWPIFNTWAANAIENILKNG